MRTIVKMGCILLAISIGVSVAVAVAPTQAITKANQPTNDANKPELSALEALEFGRRLASDSANYGGNGAPSIEQADIVLRSLSEAYSLPYSSFFDHQPVVLAEDGSYVPQSFYEAQNEV